MPDVPTTIDLSPSEVREKLAADEIVLVDVREPFEYAEARIAGARLHPLGTLDAEAIRRDAEGRTVVFHCVAGSRSADAAAEFASQTGPDADRVHHLAGGLDAWIAGGHPVIRPDLGRRLPVMRQVQITAGGLVAGGTVLGLIVHPGFFAVPAFVGCGLVFAGVTGWCGMAKLLARMPWNRVAAGPPTGDSCGA